MSTASLSLPLPLALLESILLQLAGAVLGAVVAVRLAGAYQPRWVRHWARAWQLRVAALLAMAAGAIVLGHSPDGGTRRIAAALLALAAFARWIEIACLGTAAAELIAEGSMTMSRRRRLLGACAALGAAGAACVLTAWIAPGLAPAVVSIGVVAPAIVLGVLQLAMAYPVIRAPRRDGDLGRVTLAFALAIAAPLAPLGYVVAGGAIDDAPAVALVVSTALLLLSFALAFGAAVWLLENEQHGNRAAAEELERLANYDSLTGLPNRERLVTLLQRALDEARRGSRRVAVIALDIDRLKLINDSLGTSAGDGVLCALAIRMRDALRDGDVVARIPGDEFVVVAPGIRDVDDARRVVQKLQEAVRASLRVDERELFVTASIGVSVYPEDGESVEGLLRHAETAMHRAREEGPDLFQLYSVRMNAAAIEQFQLETALRRAVAGNQLELYWQPIVDGEWNDVKLVEATLRWRHPELGLLRPAHFLAIAEQTELILEIGDWALEQACRQLRSWRVRLPALRASVNLSTRQLRRRDLADHIAHVAQHYALPVSALELEISESTASACDEPMLDQLRALRHHGARVAIDDFGTGFTSIGMLRSFPADALKIDTSFVVEMMHSPRDGKIAAAVIALAHALGLTVVAEGVETPAQLELLRREGCELWQGYLCCPPVTASEVTRVLERKLGSRKIAANEGGSR